MGLDLYVGSLTRYYSGSDRADVRPSFFDRLFRGRRIRNSARAVDSWRRQMARQLKLGDALTWNEEPEAACFIDKPAWDCYGALVLWASYDEQPNARRATSADNWSSDPAYRAAAMNPRSRYLHLVGGSEIWLPVDFATPIETKSLLNESVIVGSSVRLLDELLELNRRTWATSGEQLAQWRAERPAYGATLETSARFGFAVFHELAQQSVRRGLPMKLDY